ncbi:DUF2017 family protein [Microbacterium aureliae]
MTGPEATMPLSLGEAVHLRVLAEQLRDLVDDGAVADPALRRLTPDAYPEDAESSAEFRRVTAGDLLGRRSADAAEVVRTIDEQVGPRTPDADPAEQVPLTLSRPEAAAWLRTLAALRLVLAVRLGVDETPDQGGSHSAADGDDARFGVYEWLAYRLDVLVRALDEDA